MKLITLIFILCSTLSMYSQLRPNPSRMTVWKGELYATPKNTLKRQKWGDIEIVAGATLMLGGSYLSIQDQVKTQGSYIPCFIFGGVLTLEGCRMLGSIGSKNNRYTTRYLRKVNR